MIKEKELIEKCLSSLSVKVGCLGTTPSLMDCDFFESYGIYPWGSQISETGIFDDHGWQRDVFQDIESWPQRDITEIQKSLTAQRSSCKDYSAIEMNAEYLEQHYSGIPYLSEEATLFYFISWMNQYNQFGLDSVLLSIGIVDQLKKYLQKKNNISFKYKSHLVELLDNYSLQDPLALGELMIRDKLLEIKDLLLHDKSDYRLK